MCSSCSFCSAFAYVFRAPLLFLYFSFQLFPTSGKLVKLALSLFIMKKRLVVSLVALSVILLSIAINLRADPDAHFIFGYVYNANDCTSPNGMIVVAYPAGDPNDNITDLIGPNCGLGGCLSNEYIFDCSLFQTSCHVNDVITVEVPYQIDHSAGPVKLTITPGGFDIAPNMTLERHYRVDIPTPCE